MTEKTDASKTVFISYRRSVAEGWVELIYQKLDERGYNVFLDTRKSSPGRFEKTILGQIAAREHFIVLLAHSALDRCPAPPRPGRAVRRVCWHHRRASPRGSWGPSQPRNRHDAQDAKRQAVDPAAQRARTLLRVHVKRRSSRSAATYRDQGAGSPYKPPVE